MAGILVLFKRVRPTTTVSFYVLSGTLLANAVSLEQSYSLIASESRSKDGLTMIRSLYFPTQNDYSLWAGSSAIHDIQTDRLQYNQAHGITELEEVIHLSGI
jgi:hypothetical protein